MAFKLATLAVDIEANRRPLDTVLRTLRDDLAVAGTHSGAAFVAHMTGALGTAALFTAGIALTRGLGDAVLESVRKASSLNEMMNKTQVVFGNSTASVLGFSDKMAQAFGSNRAIMLDAASSFGLIAKGAGLSESAAAGLSTKLVRLADDASSFYHVGLDVALYKIQAGLVGQSRPLRAFGVLLDEASVKSEAVRMGLAKHGQELDNTAKIMARVSLIQKGLTDATGDHIRTMDQYANLTREVDGRVENLGTTIGTSLLPTMTLVKQDMAGWLKDAQYLADALLNVGKSAKQLAEMREAATKREEASRRARELAAEEATPEFKRAAKAKDIAEKETEKPADEAALGKAREEAYKIKVASDREKLRARLFESATGTTMSEVLKGKPEEIAKAWKEEYDRLADMDINALDRYKSIAKEKVGLALGFTAAIKKGAGETLSALAGRFLTGKDVKESRGAAEAALALKTKDEADERRRNFVAQTFTSGQEQNRAIETMTSTFGKKATLAADELREIKKNSDAQVNHLKVCAESLKALVGSSIPAVFAP